MKTIPLLIALLFTTPLFAADVPAVSSLEAARLVADGKAVLVDVREPSEWARTGVAAPAVLLPKSEFDAGLAGGWGPFLEGIGDRQIILYCASGRRSGIVGAALSEMGHAVANASGFRNWQAAGLPVRPVNPARP